MYIKKLIGLLVITAMMMPFSSRAQNDNYYGPVKISFYGFVCHQPTNDDGLGMDGVGDEVSFMFLTWEYFFTNRSSFNAFQYVYGENFLAGSDRVKAGSATINGGVKAGDTYTREGVVYDNDPGSTSKYAIETGFASENTLITILPVIWERDKDNPAGKPIQDFGVAARKAFNDRTIQQALLNQRSQCNNYNGSNPYAYIYPGSITGTDNYFAGHFSDWRTRLLSRPVGILTNGQFRSKLLVFTPWLLMQLAKKDFGYGTGIIPVQYDDAAQGNTVGKGNYTILLKIVADIKKRETTPPPPPPPASANPATTIVGTWSGIQTTASGSYPNAVGFELTAAREFIMKDAAGNLVSKGTYTYTNNILQGSFKQLSSSETFSFSGSFDTQKQKLVCTLGSGNSTTGQGKWELTKK